MNLTLNCLGLGRLSDPLVNECVLIHVREWNHHS